MLNVLTPVYAIDTFLPIAKWLCIGVAILALIIALVLFLVDRKNFSNSLKKILLSLFIFLLILGITLLVLKLIKNYSLDEIGDEVLRLNMIKFILIPLIVVASTVLLSTITAILVAKLSKVEYAKKNLSLTLKICVSIILCALVSCAVCLGIYYKDLGDENINSPVLYVSVILLIAVVVALSFIINKNKSPLDTKCIALAGVLVAMSFGLSYIKIFKLPQGGSITLVSLLPIMIFSYAYGTKKGVLVCFCYGLLQAIQDPWIVHPAQFLLDYPVAFACIGLSGAFNSIPKLQKAPQLAILLGGILASALRYISHLLSGVFAFATYAGDVNPWIYSMGYNSFVFVDMAIALVVAVILFSSKSFIKELTKNRC